VSGVLTQSFMLAGQAVYFLSHTCSVFSSGYFGNGKLRTVCPGWISSVILPISASQEARIEIPEPINWFHFIIIIIFFNIDFIQKCILIIYLSC
jgi:hypothetical protein